MGRSPCCEKNGLKKGPWSQEEDQKLLDYIQKYGYGNWRTLPTNAGLQRCGKSCRLRWTNYLRPDIKRGRFSFQEEETIIQLQSILGNKWSLIAARLPGRTDNEIKNFWNTNIRKRLLRMGIDPVTHSPLLHLLDLSTILKSPVFNNSSTQMKFSTISGSQPCIIPELLRFAASLFSSHHHTQDFPMQNKVISSNQFPPPLVQASVQDVAVHPHSCVDTKLVNPFALHADVQELHQNPSGYGMPSSLIGEYVPLLIDGYCGSSTDPPFVDPTPSSVTSDVQPYNYCSNDLGFQSSLSNMSTPSSCQTPLNSNNSPYVISCSSTEDEMESYYNSLLQFEIPDSLDVNDFMLS
ncbi:hypothetical protein F511_21519 [Dorcoceras hygrometricum]|uniref:Uncharacterized protein n=1 Tax=Dorcoceras hygrometricum TaxID=472368 RepID=A0A2Z7D1A4_9LAMI|nr:hypothetical protein F511_21519 [Dorcoceras hygrometricum]